MNANKHLLFVTSLLAGSLLFLSSCHPRSYLLEPQIDYTPQPQQITTLPSDFNDLTPEEIKEEWGKEMKIAIGFSREFDLYRAITGFKRALFLMPPHEIDRRLQAQYSIIQCYWLGKKYQDAIESFETSNLLSVSSSFPAFRELLIMLYDSFQKTDQEEKAQTVMILLEKGDPGSALDLKIFTSISEGDINNTKCLATNHEYNNDISLFIDTFCCCKKSVRKAQTLNAILPGAGYYYVGQKKSALTSFVINTSFIAASYYFFNKGNWGAGMITSSLEFGWYFGGINGAGLAAKEYNQCIYQNMGSDLMINRNMFPVLLLQTSF